MQDKRLWFDDGLEAEISLVVLYFYDFPSFAMATYNAILMNGRIPTKSIISQLLLS